jgi:hypothetical protein
LGLVTKFNRNELHVKWHQGTTEHNTFTIWKEDPQIVNQQSVLVNLTATYQENAIQVHPKSSRSRSKSVSLSEDALRCVESILEDEFTPLAPLPAVISSTDVLVSPSSPSSSSGRQTVPLSPLPTVCLSATQIFTSLSRCSLLKEFIQTVRSHDGFPWEQVLAVEYCIWKRLRHLDNGELIFVTRFPFTFNNQEYVFVRGIESLGCVGTLQSINQTNSTTTVVESLVTHDLVSALEAMTISSAHFDRLLQRIRFSELEKHAYSPFEFTCIAIKVVSQQPRVHVLAKSSPKFSTFVTSLLRTRRQDLYVTNESRPKRHSLNDVVRFDANTSALELSQQMQLFNCLPAIMVGPVNSSGRFTMPQHADRQSIRYAVLHGISSLDVDVALQKFRRPPPTKTKVPKRKRVPLTHDPGFSQTVADFSSQHVDLPLDLPTETIPAPSHTFFSSLISRGLVRCIDQSQTMLVFLWNGKFLLRTW